MYQPLSYAFSMLEVGGSAVQNYSFIDDEFFPDRAITPYKLIPHLEISDPSGIIGDGDVSMNLTECRWTVNGSMLPSSADFTVDSEDHSLTIGKNVPMGERYEIAFVGHFLDKRRGEVAEFTWKTMLATNENVDFNISLDVDCPKKLEISPMRMQQVLVMTARLMNGGKTLKDSDCVFSWSYRDPDMTEFKALSSVDFSAGQMLNPCWYSQGQGTKTLTVFPPCIDNTLVKLEAYHKAVPKQKRIWVGRIKRSYGQYTEGIMFTEGKYIFPDTTRAVGRATVTNGKGDITDPARFFDIEIFYTRGGSSVFRSVAYGEEGEVPRKDFGADLTAKHKFGVMVRERTALRPLAVNGVAIVVNGKPLAVNQPTVEREV